MKFKVLLLIIFSTIITSCKSADGKGQESVITEKYWKIKTLNGKEIKTEDTQKREIFITLKTEDNRITGFAGCNTISGEYVLEEGNSVKFSKIAVTQMFCPNTNESEFLKVLNSTDNYTIKNNILSLNEGKKASLATFEAVNMN